MLTNKLIKSFYICQYKAKNEISNDANAGFEFQDKWIENKLYEKYISDKRIVPHKLSIDLALPENEYPKFLEDNFYQLDLIGESVHINIPLIEIQTSKKKEKNIIPYIFIPADKIEISDKKYLALLGIFLSNSFRVNILHGRIVFGRNLKTTKFTLSKISASNQDLIEIKRLANNKEIRPIFNRYCQVCKYAEKCREEMIERDDLSLLKRMSDKEVKKLHKKGIRTITQLSYNFKPRRRRKTTQNRGRYLYELKALSIRENKTYVLEKATMVLGNSEIYIDFEGDLRHSIYLIGVVIYEGKKESKFSFWAKNEKEEVDIFFHFFELLKQYENSVIYHYGNYEIKAIEKANKKYNLVSDIEIQAIKNISINILDYFYSKIFPPTYSNGLKEISQHIGFNWTKKNVNGLVSVYWRRNWLEFRQEKIKRALYIYNIEDCLALKSVKDWLVKIFDNEISESKNVIDAITHFEKNSRMKFGKSNLSADFIGLDKLAYFNYQREKVYLRDKEFKKNQKKVKSKTRKIKTNKTVIPNPPSFCPRCNHSKLTVHQNCSRFLFDMKISETSIKREQILFKNKRFRCVECRYVFTPIISKKLPVYGKNITKWVINQRINYRMSYYNIQKSLEDYFGLSLPISQLTKIRGDYSNMFFKLYENLSGSIFKGELIHADETKIRLKSIDGYVWAFTNLTTAIYIFKPNRSGEFLQELLENFKGVLLSDFYSVYDGFDCPQQKCLIHLIRDINDDLFKNQQNEDLQFISMYFGSLLRKIVMTIDKYGLKKRNLRKHKSDVSRFYKKLEDRTFTSEIGLSLKKRFQKNKGKLFTFLDYDNVPWNNNNAEHAIKAFAVHRRNFNGMMSEKGINEFLIILSIYETCKFRGINFWDFIKSERTGF